MSSFCRIAGHLGGFDFGEIKSFWQLFGLRGMGKWIARIQDMLHQSSEKEEMWSGWLFFFAMRQRKGGGRRMVPPSSSSLPEFLFRNPLHRFYILLLPGSERLARTAQPLVQSLSRTFSMRRLVFGTSSLKRPEPRGQRPGAGSGPRLASLTRVANRLTSGWATRGRRWLLSRS